MKIKTINQPIILEILSKLNISKKHLIGALEEYGAKDSSKPTIRECIYTAHDIVLDTFKIKIIENQDDKLISERFNCISAINVGINTDENEYGFKSPFEKFDFLDTSIKNCLKFISTHK